MRIFPILVLLSCKPEAKPTPAGTVVLDWTESKTALDHGVSLGSATGASIHDQRMVDFTPSPDVRDKSLRTVQIEVGIDREDVAIIANAAGNRPAELGALPRHATAKVLESGGWQLETAKCDEMTGPGDIGERDKRVGFFVTCQIVMNGGREDTGTVTLTIAGNGKHTAAGAFGTAAMR
jgi:hypothetical protein